MNSNKYQVGDEVFILCRRSTGECVSVAPQHPSAGDYPVERCLVAQVNVCGVEGCYGLAWADSNEPVGLPFFERSMASTERELIKQVDNCKVPL